MVMVRKCASDSLIIFIIFIILFFPAIILSIHSYFSSSSSSSFPKFIHRGSSISTSSNSTTSSFLLSPSGLFAFGFYPLNSCDHQEYIIGIWLVKSSQRTLMWSINRDELPYSTFNNSTSLLLNHDGKFVVQTSTTTYNDGHRMNFIKEIPLFQHDISPVTFALLHDNGNLVFLDWDHNTIWESFDYPTDTILPGQTLNPGQSLVPRHSNKSDVDKNRLTMKEDGNLVLFKEKKHTCNVSYKYVHWESYTKKKASPVVLRLNSTGHLYLVDWNGYIMKRLNNDNDHDNNSTKQQNDDEGMIAAAEVMYRATLDSDGEFRLYKEIIRSSSSLGECECECEKTENSSIILWSTTKWSSSRIERGTYDYVIVNAITLFVGLGSAMFAKCVIRSWNPCDVR